MIFDNVGNVVERYIYDPFGSVTVLDADWNVQAGGRAYNWSYLHQGGRFDVTSGLYHFRFRDYSPSLGRWTSMDPIRYEAGDVNLYRFVFNAPINLVDPTGLDADRITDCRWGGALYLLPSGTSVWSDLWSLVFPERSRDYLASPLHPNFNPNQTNRPNLKAGDIIDRNTRDWHHRTT